MKRKAVSIMLICAILCSICGNLGLISSAKTNSSYSTLTVYPIYNQDTQSTSNTPNLLVKEPVSTFTAAFDYTVKKDQSLSLLYDVDNSWDTVYECDFNNSETLSLAEGTGTVTNTDGAIVLEGSNWLQTENIAENLTNFDMSLDVSYWHGWTNAGIYLRDEELSLFFRGSDSAANLDPSGYVVLTNLSTGENITYDTTATDKRIRVLAVDKSVKVYADNELIIDYTYPEDATPKSGSIFFTSTECNVTYDNVLIKAPKTGFNADDSYMQLNIGENVSLSEKITVAEQIAISDVNLEAGKTYSFEIKRNMGNITVLADGDEVLSTEISYPYKDISNGLIGISSSSDDSVNNISIFNSTNININDNYAEILPVQTEVNKTLGVSSQEEWVAEEEKKNDASINLLENEFSVTSPSSLNGSVITTDFLNNSMADVYIKFDLKNNRDNWTYDKFYFAGYSIGFNADASTDQNLCTVSDASGNTISCNSKYRYYGMNYYTLELIKKGNTVTAYYYPAGSERTLLFTDSNCTAAVTNLSVRKQQGTLYFRNFAVYDTIPDEAIPSFGLYDTSMYVLTSDGIGCIPMGTSVREVKANIINSSVINITRNGEILSDTDTVITGDIITSEKIENAQWKIGTLGDLDGDGDVTDSDVSLANTAFGTTSDQTAALAGADIDQNGIIDASDVTALENISLGNSDMTYIKRSIVGDALLEHCKVIGRQYYEENLGVNFEWTASNITLGGYMKGDVTVTINYDSGEELDETAVDVFIDGNTSNPYFMHLSMGVNTYTIATDLEPGYHTVQIMKNNESIMGAFYMEAIEFTGTPMPVADSDRKIEFLGDSITAGCGVLLSNDSDWYHYNYHTYASVASRELGADYYCVSNSGWGFARHLKNPYTINRVYDLATDRRDIKYTYDFSWKPDLVVINLGTNDNTALNNQRSNLENDGDNTTNFDYTSAEANYKSEVVAMLDRVRSYNPNAKIIWTYGAMGFGFTDPTGRTTGDWIKEAVESYNETDGNVMFYRMPESMNGGGSHPDAIGSKYLGEDFAEVIAEFMNWEYEPTVYDTYQYGDTVADYTFDDSTEGIIANNSSLVENKDSRLHLISDNNLNVLSSAFAGNKYLDTYEMTFDWEHEGAKEWNREIFTLRSPNSSLTDAIYLTFLGTNLATIGNYFNPLDIEKNVQLVASKNGVKTELGSLNLDDIYSGKKKINVKMGIDYLEITIWNADEEMPNTPTFSVEISEEIAPAHGDIFMQGRNSNNYIDNLNITYGVNVEVIGDLNNSGVTDATDVVLMRKYLLGDKEGILNRFATDANRDASIDLRDLVRIKKESATIS